MHSAAQSRAAGSVCSFESWIILAHSPNQLEIQLYFLTNTTTTGPKRFLSLLGSWELVAFKSSNFGRWHCKWVCQRSMVPLNLWSFPDVMVRVDAPFPCRCWLGVAGRQLMSSYHRFFFSEPDGTIWQYGEGWWGVETSRFQAIRRVTIYSKPYIAILNFIQWFNIISTCGWSPDGPWILWDIKTLKNLYHDGGATFCWFFGLASGSLSR